MLSVDVYLRAVMSLWQARQDNRMNEQADRLRAKIAGGLPQAD